ncbi:MAG: hypothetical protein HOJ79_14550 [Nitrospina sp.]|jgi:hypothetical protein|nr:hypothetical protein [Nitrospina sp.]
MRTDFTSGFNNARNSKSNAPVNLLQIDWPEMNNLPALTLRLSDREGITINSVDWYPLINNLGNLDRLVSTDQTDSNSHSNFSVSVVNVPVDLFSPVARFSNLFRNRPPESGVVTFYQWFADDGLTDTDLSILFVARIGDPINYDEAVCSFDLVDISQSYGSTVIGNAITLNDYPNAPEDSVGKTKPIVIGNVDEVPGLLVRKSQETQLTSVAIPGGTLVDVSSTQNFPASGTFIVNDDEVNYTSLNSTQFLGCSGINEFHYSGDSILEKVNDHRYLFSDPDYPIKQISNVKVGGHLADTGEFSIDIPNGEINFSSKPKISDSIDTKFLQAQNDLVGTGNTAVNPTNALIPNSPSTYAKINQNNKVLSLKQVDSLPNIGTIGKVLLRVEHFVEEKLPNDSLTAHIIGIGQVGSLSSPAVDDVVVANGNIDITHTHLDTFGFPISDPQHQHAEAQPPKITQNALSGVGGQVITKTSGQIHTISFPDPGPGTWATAEYGITFEWAGTLSASGTVDVNAQGSSGGPFYRLWRRQGTTETYTTGGNINTDINSIRITHNASVITYYIRSATRIITMATPLNTNVQATNTSTSKTGSLTQHSSNPAISSTSEKATRSVVDFIDITNNVNGDWNWFTNRESQIQYNGASDGRTAFIIHLAYEIEYARRRIQFTDDVRAEIQGLKDDAIGTLTGTADSLIERPDHVYKWSILKALNLDISVLDINSLNQAGALFSSVGYLLAGVITDKVSARGLWNQWGKESRSFLFWDLGLAKILYRSLNLVDTNTMPDKVILDNMVLLDSQDRIRFKASRNPIAEVVNKVDLKYRKNWAGEGFNAVQSGSDVDSIKYFGQKEKPVDFEFNWIRMQALAVDLVLFYLQERSCPRDVYEIELLLDNMEIQRGDILEVNPPTHELNNVKVMVLGAGRSVGSGVAQRMDTVPVIARQMRGFVANSGFGLAAFGRSGFGGAENN